VKPTCDQRPIAGKQCRGRACPCPRPSSRAKSEERKTGRDKPCPYIVFLQSTSYSRPRPSSRARSEERKTGRDKPRPYIAFLQPTSLWPPASFLSRKIRGEEDGQGQALPLHLFPAIPRSCAAVFACREATDRSLPTYDESTQRPPGAEESEIAPRRSH
jgi:hypothetical protein